MTEALLLNLHDNRLLAALPADTLALMERELRPASLAQGMVIFEAGAPVDQIVFPQTGLLSLLVVTKNGGTIEAMTIGREGALGLHGGLGERRSFTRALVQIGGDFLTMRASRFSQMIKDEPALRDLIGRYTEFLWAEAQQFAACNAVHDASSRLCRWLLQSADRTGSDKLPLTQEFLGQVLGVRRTTVTLLAQELQAKGVIKYSRGQITILNRRGLEAAACECYHVIDHQRLPSALGVTL